MSHPGRSAAAPATSCSGTCSRGAPKPAIEMVAVIATAPNQASIGLHLKHGFRRIGTIEACGYKQGSWVDSVILQRALGPGAGTLP